jgi:hypothetical protein
VGAAGEVAAAAIPADPAIMPAATSAISAGLPARDFSRALRVCWVRVAGWFWLIGFLPVMIPGRRRLVVVAVLRGGWPDGQFSACLIAMRRSVNWPTRLVSAR